MFSSFPKLLVNMTLRVCMQNAPQLFDPCVCPLAVVLPLELACTWVVVALLNSKYMGVLSAPFSSEEEVYSYEDNVILLTFDSTAFTKKYHHKEAYL